VTFPCVELKFTAILRRASGTSLNVRLYRVDDGGLDAKGNPLYLRTLKRSRRIELDPGITKAQVLAAAKDKLQTWAIEEGFTLTPDRLLCSL
jgi:hypothetical protein